MPKLNVAVVVGKVPTRNNAPREVMAREYIRETLLREIEKYLDGNLDDFLTERDGALGDRLLHAEMHIMPRDELQEYIDGGSNG